MTEKDISVFVDESGSFDPDVGSSRYYVICLVLHDQASDISEAVERLSRSEFEFFNGIQNLNRNYFKPIDQKRHR